ncbi:hypothetical protein EV368DRAFT_64399 [Lentinula lateritia]|nr:hypothetical protein EV368DRAFT_64399 [Lentinula lateritia]
MTAQQGHSPMSWWPYIIQGSQSLRRVRSAYGHQINGVLTVFAGRVNGTRYPGLQGCWDPVIPGLNLTAYWGRGDSFNGLPTHLVFQPWVFPASSTNITHHQVIMVIATQKNQSLLIDTKQAAPKIHATHIQAIGCTLTSHNLTATIDTQSRLLDPHTDVMQREGPELPHDDHAWDEFGWKDSTNLAGIDRQFLLAFSPTSFYNNTLNSYHSMDSSAGGEISLRWGARTMEVGTWRPRPTGIGIEIIKVYDILHEASACQQQEFTGDCLRGSAWRE